MFKFETLEVWKKAISYADELLEIAENLPRGYQFSLSDQLKRAGISVTNNIAEGSGRSSEKESTQLFNVAKGSTYETINLLKIALNRKLVSQETYDQLYAKAEEIAKMLSGLMSSTSKSKRFE